MKDIYKREVAKLKKAPAWQLPTKSLVSKMPKLTSKNIYQEISQMVGKSKGFIGSFIAQPLKVNFEGQEPEEKIILLVRRHWITNFGWVAIATLMIFSPFILTKFFLLIAFPPPLGFAAIILWYLLTLAFVIQGSLSWLFNVGIITNKRVIDFDFYALFYKRISDAEINKIQDVTVRVNGALRTLFDFGDVFIQTAGERPEIEFQDIPHPSLVAKVLEKLRLASQS